ncbi:MAG: hypothetical protein ABJF01_16890 [bacterium]
MPSDRERKHADALLDSTASKTTSVTQGDGTTDSPDDIPVDPNDEIPVPIAMAPAEIDERAQVVEALRGNGPAPRTDTQIDP